MFIKNVAVLITGAGSGMGAEVARTLVGLGGKVALLDQNYQDGHGQH